LLSTVYEPKEDYKGKVIATWQHLNCGIFQFLVTMIWTRGNHCRKARPALVDQGPLLPTYRRDWGIKGAVVYGKHTSLAYNLWFIYSKGFVPSKEHPSYPTLLPRERVATRFEAGK